MHIDCTKGVLTHAMHDSTALRGAKDSGASPLHDLTPHSFKNMDNASFRSETLRRVCTVGIAFAFLNVPFWWLQQEYFLVRPWLNIELLLPVLLIPRWPRLGLVALAICWLLDFTVSQSATFRFDSAFDFIRSAVFLSQTHLLSFLTVSRLLMAIPFVAAAAVAWWLARSIGPQKLPWMICLSFAAIISFVDITNGSSIFSSRSIRLLPGNPAGSPTFTLAIRAWQSRIHHELTPLPRGTAATEVADVEGWAKRHPDGRAVLVLVESMGWHHDPGMRQWLLDRVSNPAIQRRYTLVDSEIGFTEATTSAELRELCGLRGGYRNMSDGVGERCLPARLAALGWKTAGYHGFSGNMFDRNAWWLETGIAHGYFAQDLFQSGDRRCGGGFPGLCDADVISRALAHAPPRSFTYILTLNSHLPLTPVPIPQDLQSICNHAGATEQTCLITATIGQALTALRLQLEAAQGVLPLVVVVGDHAPPFSDLASRGEYNDHTVPAFVLKPRETPVLENAPRSINASGSLHARLRQGD